MMKQAFHPFPGGSPTSLDEIGQDSKSMPPDLKTGNKEFAGFGRAVQGWTRIPIGR